MKEQADREKNFYDFNSGNAVMDKYGYYVHMGFNMRTIVEAYPSGAGKCVGRVWIGNHNPTVSGRHVDGAGYSVYIIPFGHDTKERIEPTAIGFATRSKAKEWANKNITFERKI